MSDSRRLPTWDDLAAVIPDVVATMHRYRHTVTRLINKAGTAAGVPHIHPTNSAIPWPPKPSIAA